MGALCFLVPQAPDSHRLHRNGWEPLFDHGLVLFIAGFLYSSSTTGRESAAARLLGHRSLVALGACSFEVYIFQRPVHDTFRLVFDVDSAEVFMVYILTLWLFAGLYAKYLQD